MTEKTKTSLEVFKNTIWSLSYSQSFYGRIRKQIEYMEEQDIPEYYELIDGINKENFKDSLDVIMYLEG